MIGDEITQRGWYYTVTFKPDIAYCFIFSETDKELGFAKGTDESVISLAFERAIEKSKRLESIRQEQLEEQPLLYQEVD